MIHVKNYLKTYELLKNDLRMTSSAYKNNVNVDIMDKHKQYANDKITVVETEIQVKTCIKILPVSLMKFIIEREATYENNLVIEVKVTQQNHHKLL